MSELTVQKINASLIEPVLADADEEGNTFKNSGMEFVHFDNSGSIIEKTITFKASGECDQGFVHDEVVTLGAGKVAYKSHFAVKRFGSTLTIEYSNVDNLKIGVFKII